MPYAKITRKEAREWKRRAENAEGKMAGLACEWAGAPIDTVDVKNPEWHIVRTARTLGFAVVVVPGDTNKLIVRAVKL